MIIVTLILLPILIYMTIKICRMVWEHEKGIVLMLIALCFTLLTSLFYFSVLIKSKKDAGWCCLDDSSCTCVSSIFAALPAFCLANAVILNLNKWIYFKMRINAFIKVGFGVDAIANKEIVDTKSDDSQSCKERKER